MTRLKTTKKKDMAYQFKKKRKTKPQKHELVKISVASLLIEMREDIEKSVQHRGQKLEIAFQAFKEIEEAHGRSVPDGYADGCTSCVVQMNKILRNWLKMYDRGSVVARAAAGGVKSKPLKPLKPLKRIKPKEKETDAVIKTSTKQNPNYATLLKRFKNEAPEDVQKSINDGKNPKKAQLIKYFDEH